MKRNKKNIIKNVLVVWVESSEFSRYLPFIHTRRTHFFQIFIRSDSVTSAIKYKLTHWNLDSFHSILFLFLVAVFFLDFFRSFCWNLGSNFILVLFNLIVCRLESIFYMYIYTDYIMNNKTKLVPNFLEMSIWWNLWFIWQNQMYAIADVKNT